MLKTCLLISDDPDDHAQFTEALDGISSSIVVVVLLDAEKARLLLSAKKHVPDYIILDLSSLGDAGDVLFDILENDPGLAEIPLVAYGEFTDRHRVNNSRINAFLDEQVSYSSLKNILLKIVGS